MDSNFVKLLHPMSGFGPGSASALASAGTSRISSETGIVLFHQELAVRLIRR
jgi:hypothetical protein